jgi:hypothetical protein
MKFLMGFDEQVVPQADRVLVRLEELPNVRSSGSSFVCLLCYTVSCLTLHHHSSIFSGFEFWSIIFLAHQKNTSETSLMCFPSIIQISLQKSAGGVLLPKSVTKFENYLVGEVCERYHPTLTVVVSIRCVSEPYLDALHHEAFSCQRPLCVCACNFCHLSLLKNIDGKLQEVTLKVVVSILMQVISIGKEATSREKGQKVFESPLGHLLRLVEFWN